MKSLKGKNLYLPKEQLERAKQIITGFNAQAGPELYPRLVGTEHPVQEKRTNYDLTGIADAITTTPDGSGLEVIDFKGAQTPNRNTARDRQNRFQIEMYALLEGNKNGVTPKQGTLYYLNAFPTQEGGTLSPKGIHQWEITKPQLTKADTLAQETIRRIEESKETRHFPEPKEPPPESLCQACELRWSCATAHRRGIGTKGSYP